MFFQCLQYLCLKEMAWQIHSTAVSIPCQTLPALPVLNHCLQLYFWSSSPKKGELTWEVSERNLGEQLSCEEIMQDKTRQSFPSCKRKMVVERCKGLLGFKETMPMLIAVLQDNAHHFRELIIWASCCFLAVADCAQMNKAEKGWQPHVNVFNMASKCCRLMAALTSHLSQF